MTRRLSPQILPPGAAPFGDAHGPGKALGRKAQETAPLGNQRIALGDGVVAAAIPLLPPRLRIPEGIDQHVGDGGGRGEIPEEHGAGGVPEGHGERELLLHVGVIGAHGAFHKDQGAQGFLSLRRGRRHPHPKRWAFLALKAERGNLQRAPALGLKGKGPARFRFRLPVHQGELAGPLLTHDDEVLLQGREVRLANEDLLIDAEGKAKDVVFVDDLPVRFRGEGGEGCGAERREKQQRKGKERFHQGCSDSGARGRPWR